jgi:hypothetical protein
MRSANKLTLGGPGADNSDQAQEQKQDRTLETGHDCVVMWMYRAAKKCDGAARAAEVPGLVSPDQVVSPPSWCSKVRVLCDKKPCIPPVILPFHSKADSQKGSRDYSLFTLHIYLAAAAILLAAGQATKFRGSAPREALDCG